MLDAEHRGFPKTIEIIMQQASPLQAGDMDACGNQRAPYPGAAESKHGRDVGRSMAETVPFRRRQGPKLLVVM
jgi:hypothetical protein